MKSFDVIALGEVLIDFTDSGISKDGQRLYEQNPGGAPANVLSALASLGAKTGFIGKVGEDTHGQFLKQVLEEKGICTQGLIVDENFFTTLAFVTLNKGERSFAFARKPGADTQLRADEVNMELLENTRLFHIGSLSLTDEPSRSATFEALEKAKANGCWISYDPNYRKALWENEEIAIERMREVIPYVDIMKISDEELEIITGKTIPKEAIDYLLKKGVKCVIITLGAKGAILGTSSLYIHEEGLKCNVVDTTGAGDAFWGGVLYQFLKNKNIEELKEGEGRQILQFANAVAACCIEKRGGIPAMPSVKEVEEKMKDYK